MVPNRLLVCLGLCWNIFLFSVMHSIPRDVGENINSQCRPLLLNAISNLKELYQIWLWYQVLIEFKWVYMQIYIVTREQSELCLWPGGLIWTSFWRFDLNTSKCCVVLYADCKTLPSCYSLSQTNWKQTRKISDSDLSKYVLKAVLHSTTMIVYQLKTLQTLSFDEKDMPKPRHKILQIWRYRFLPTCSILIKNNNKLQQQ